MISTLVAAWLLPPLFPLLLVLAGWYALRARPRTARALIAGGAVLMLLLSIPVVGSLLVATLEAPFTDPLQQPADAIVVLGGGIAAAHPPELPEPDLNEGADRMWQAARLWKRGAAPRIIVTGGSFLAKQGGTPLTEADAMRVFLIDLGVPADAITDEGKALNTIENIRNVRAIIGQGRVALVTSAYHMPRALQLAARAGLNVGAFPTDFQVVPATRLPWDNWLPSVDGLQLSNMALREIIALNLDYRRSSLDQ